MPIYPWECPSCWRTAEKIVPVADRNLIMICVCGQAMNRLPAGANFRLPGGNPKIDYEHAFNTDLYGKEEADAIRDAHKGSDLSRAQ